MAIGEKEIKIFEYGESKPELDKANQSGQLFGKLNKLSYHSGRNMEVERYRKPNEGESVDCAIPSSVIEFELNDVPFKVIYQGSEGIEKLRNMAKVLNSHADAIEVMLDGE